MYWVGPGAAKKNLEEYEKYFEKLEHERRLTDRIRKIVQEDRENHAVRSRAGRELVKEKADSPDSRLVRRVVRQELRSFFSSLSIEQCRVCGKEFLARPDQIDEDGAVCDECFDGASEPAASSDFGY